MVDFILKWVLGKKKKKKLSLDWLHSFFVQKSVTQTHNLLKKKYKQTKNRSSIFIMNRLNLSQTNIRKINNYICQYWSWYFICTTYVHMSMWTHISHRIQTHMNIYVGHTFYSIKTKINLQIAFRLFRICVRFMFAKAVYRYYLFIYFSHKFNFFQTFLLTRNFFFFSAVKWPA